MAQVLTNENMQEFIEKRSVPEFVPPAAPAPVTIEGEAKTVDTDNKTAQRDPATGKFVAKTDEPKPAAPAAADDTDPEDADLPERVKRQIGKKHRAMKEAEEFARERDAEAAREKQRADTAERELETLRGSKSRPDPQSTVADPGEPKPEDFKTVAEYAKALTKYELEKARAEDAKKAEADRARAQQTKTQTEFEARLTKARADIPDYDEVVADADVNVPAHIAQYIMSEDLGPLIGYHFAKHPDELERLSKLSPIRAIAELGKLEAKLETKPAAAEVPRVSKAPSPITPLDGGQSQSSKEPKDMTFQELRAHRQAERSAGKR